MVTAKALADAAGLKYSQIDHWSDKHLLVFERLNGRTRTYNLEENLARCRFIQKMQRKAEGQSLEAIAEMLRRGAHRNP